VKTGGDKRAGGAADSAAGGVAGSAAGGAADSAASGVADIAAGGVADSATSGVANGAAYCALRNSGIGSPSGVGQAKTGITSPDNRTNEPRAAFVI